MRVLVTGATGFAGSHLMDVVRKQDGVEAYGTSAHASDVDHIVPIDLTEADAVERLLEDTKPDVIYHLAAFASPAESFKRPVEAINSTLEMQVNIYESCLKLGIHPRVVVVSSGQIYGRAEASQLPLKETNPLDFASPYAVAKVGQENLASLYGKRGIESVVARPFNHIGPRQQPGFLISDLSKQIAELESAPGDAKMRVGNLASKRDFTDARDIVRAYTLLAEKGVAGEVYNVCTGTSRSGQEMLDMLLKLSHKQIETEPDPERMRPADIPDLYGDASKIKRDTGWEPQIPLEQTLADTLEYWRQQIGRR
jgi:GDP-4-dehydro-6-deoxy-D-mannose reductase